MEKEKNKEEENIKKEVEEVTPQKVEKDDNQNLSSSKKNNGLVIGLVVIILLLAAALVYVLFFTKDKEKETIKDNNTQETEKNNDKEEEKEYEEPKEQETQEETKGDYELTVYKYKDGGDLSDSNKSDEFLTKAFTIKVNNKNAKVLTVENNSQYVLYNDNGLYLYNAKTKESTKVNLENTYKEYAIYANEKLNKIIGIGFLNNSKKFGYYNIAKDTILYNNKYEVEVIWEVSQINDHYLSLRSNKMVYLLSSDEEKTNLSYKDEDGIYEYRSFGESGNYIYALTIVMESDNYQRLYNNKFEMFYKVPEDYGIWSSRIDLYNDYLYFYVEDKLYKYDRNGNLISTSSDYKDVEIIARGYIVYLKNNNLTIEQIDDATETKELTKWNENWYVNDYFSGYYSKEDLDNLKESNKKEGIYVVVYYNEKDSKGNYGMEYCYTTDKEVVTYPIKTHDPMDGLAKPVLYLYPTKETNVTVTFSHPEYLRTTYPKYINSWNVKVSPNGDMYDKDGKYYYALYWDEKRYNEVDFHEGFYVESKDAIKFLEEKLTLIGLSDKERNEFIMYWLPIMENNKKNLVYFELTKERELGNKLIIEPKPDSLLRVSIHIKKVNEKINIKEQKLETFKRSCFTAVEWGGMTY